MNPLVAYFGPLPLLQSCLLNSSALILLILSFLVGPGFVTIVFKFITSVHSQRPQYPNQILLLVSTDFKPLILVVRYSSNLELTRLLVARVKKIVHADDEIQNCSNNAAFVITIATEMFIQHLVEKTHEIVKAEKRPRRNVQYGDVGMSRVI